MAIEKKNLFSFCIFSILRILDIEDMKGILFSRHTSTLFLHSVANHSPCRNNSDKNLANFLESAKNHRTFASVI